MEGILLSCGVNANVLRFLFPLTISHALFDEAFGVLRDALTSPAGRPHCPRASGQPGRLRRALS